MNTTNRRDVLKKLALGSLAMGVAPAIGIAGNEAIAMPLNKKINHSVCYWTHNFLSLDELCTLVKKIGFNAIDLLKPDEWKIVQKHGITCSMCYTAGKISLTEGWNNTANHSWLIKDFTEAIPMVSNAGYKNLICFSGNRNGMDDETGLKNCVTGLKQILPLAEKNGVINFFV